MTRQQNAGKLQGKSENLTNAGKGRVKGVPNKMTGQVKEMILAALDKAGGADYLAEQAQENPAAFMSLVGKVLPLTLAGDPNAPLQVQHKMRERVETVLTAIEDLTERHRQTERLN